MEENSNENAHTIKLNKNVTAVRSLILFRVFKICQTIVKTSCLDCKLTSLNSIFVIFMIQNIVFLHEFDLIQRWNFTVLKLKFNISCSKSKNAVEKQKKS